jgi:hypothetical protein
MVKANGTLILHVVLFRLETGFFTLLEKNVGGVFETGLVRRAFCESGEIENYHTYRRLLG